MSNFPSNFDDDTTLPFVNDNIVDIGGEAINAARDAIFNIETEIGIGASGTKESIAQRLGVALRPDGSINPSALTSLGLVTLPITNAQIINNANIPESKLKLDYKTINLFNYIKNTANDTNTALGWISITGIKVEPHILGAIYRHDLTHIDINSNPAAYFKDKYGAYRTTSNSYTALNNLNDEFLDHQFLDGYPVTANSIVTYDGTTMSANYAHPASGIFLNTNRFAIIPDTVNDLQQFAQFLDDSGMFIYGSRIQNLYSNGISKSSRSPKLGSQTLGPSIVPLTPVITYLLNNGTDSSPRDNIDNGDDIIEFKPINTGSPFTFDTQFSLVKPGDIIRVNYGSVEVPFVIKEKKFVAGSTYIIRIAGKNLMYTADGYASIDKPLFNNNKYGVLACAAANLTTSIMPSLIIGSPRNAMALGLGFNPGLLDKTHYLLYLALYPTGHPQDGYVFLPPIDVTGNVGATPGSYTLDSVVSAINNQFRQPGYNYRFIAFSYQGELGIMMSDCYNNAAFSIISGAVSGAGSYDQTLTNSAFPNNVVGIFATAPLTAPDPLGFGSSGAAIASPPYMNTYGSTEAAQIPTKLFVPVTRANYYVNGAEKDKLSLEEGQILDGYGDGYWHATIINKTTPGGTRISTTYHVANLDLSSTNLKVGKTLVVQSAGYGTMNDYGRFVIESITFGCGTNAYTDITVYDAAHATKISGPLVSTSAIGTEVAIYFNSDSVSFNSESATDFLNESPFKRHFEIFVDENSNTFTHERGRVNISGSDIEINEPGNWLRSTTELSKLDIIRISPKLRGYQFGSVTKISLRINTFTASGDFDGYLCSYDGFNCTKLGPTVSGRIGEVARFYDETCIDYIDIIFDINASMTLPFVSAQIIDFQLFSSLALDEEIMMIATCQHNTVTNIVNYLRDERQFGNVSEKELSTSAIAYISLPDKLMHANGVYQGFDLQAVPIGTNPNDNQIYLKGGSALVNGKVVYKNSETVEIPKLQEYFGGTGVDVVWALCINDKSEYQPIPLLDGYALLPSNDRIFQAYNPLTLQTYYLDSAYFSDIVNNRKDLTPLYTVYSSISIVGGEAVSTLSIQDIRRYSLDVESNLPLKYNVGQNQGNFKSIQAVFNWLNYNGPYNGEVLINNGSAGYVTINNAVNLGYKSTDFGSIVIDGNNSTSLEFNDHVNIGSNVTFRNINLRFLNTVTFNSDAVNIHFENCIITITPSVTPTSGVMFNFNSVNKVTFDECLIYAAYPVLYSGGSLFRFTDSSNINFLNSSVGNLLFNIAASPIEYIPGYVFDFINTSQITIENSSFYGNFIGCVKLGNLCNAAKIKNNTISSIFTATSYSIYSSTNLVNSGYGYIQATISNTLDKVFIEDNTFNCIPYPATDDRFSFINFELSSMSSVISDLKITGCRFNNNNNGTTTEDIRAAISIINTAPATSSTDPQPIISNVIISNNTCNKSQGIVITSVTSNDRMVYPGLNAINCNISNNICGTIGYWIGAGTKYINNPLSYNPDSYNSGLSNLTIENNTCYYIATQDHLGMYFVTSERVSGVSTAMSDYPSGFVAIKNNNASWIHVGQAYEDNCKLSITDNHLSCYNHLYIENQGDVIDYTSDGHGLATGHAIFVDSNPYTASPIGTPKNGNDGNCIISGNIIGAGYWNRGYLVSPTSVTYKYYGGIYCKPSNIITHNILRGIEYEGIIVGGASNNITDNKIYREDNSFNRFVAFLNVDSTPWDGTNSSGLVVDNYFDKPTLYDGDTTMNLLYLPPYYLKYPCDWIIERNINQTVTRKLRIKTAHHTAKNDGAVASFWTLPTGLTPTFDAYGSDFTVDYDHTTTGGNQRKYIIDFELTHIIPPETKLVYVDAKTTLSVSAGTPIAATYVGMRVNNEITQVTSLGHKDISRPATAPYYHVYTASPETYNFIAQESDGDFDDYINSINGYLTIQLFANFLDNTNDITLVIEPITIKYRW